MARNKGPAVCTNIATIRRQDLEVAVLNALAHHLMDPEAVEIFCAEYAAERKPLLAQANAGRAGLEKKLRQITTDHAKLVDAILAGAPAEQLKDRMIDLDASRKGLQRVMAATSADFHPSMAKTYRIWAEKLIRGLSEPDGAEEVKEALRSLVEKIVLVPVTAKDGAITLAIDLHGALAGLPCLATCPPLRQVAAARHADAAPGAEAKAPLI